MRLSCPNCAAQYEVPAEAIPPSGRDVQCSACGHTWFEQPAEGRPRLLGPDPLDEASRVEGDAEEEDDLAELRAAPPLPAFGIAPGPTGPVPPPPTMEEAAPARPRVAPEVERILREEAEREAQARAEEAARRVMPDPVPEPVPEIGRPGPRRLRTLDDDGDEEGLVRRGAPPVAPGPRPAPRPARQVDRAVDLDRINSTLRSHGDQIGSPAPQVERAGTRRRRGGFLSGFMGTLLILAALVALYVWSEEITAVVPQAAVVLDPYADAVTQARFWLDRELARLLGATNAGL